LGGIYISSLFPIGVGERIRGIHPFNTLANWFKGFWDFWVFLMRGNLFCGFFETQLNVSAFFGATKQDLAPFFLGGNPEEFLSCEINGL